MMLPKSLRESENKAALNISIMERCGEDVSPDVVKQLVAYIKLLEAEVSRNTCDCCLGDGVPISGKPCMCRGTGRMSDAADYLRQELVKLEMSISNFNSQYVLRFPNGKFITEKNNWTRHLNNAAIFHSPQDAMMFMNNETASASVWELNTGLRPWIGSIGDPD